MPKPSFSLPLLILLIPFIGLSQDLPVDEGSGKITYSEVVQVEGTPKDKLYDRALNWAKGYYKNPSNVIREKDKARGTIICKARYRLNNPPDKKGVITSAGDAMYTLTIQFKDDKFRYIITDINWMKLSAFPGERWLDESSDTYLPVYKHYLSSTDTEIKDVISSLVKSVSAPEKVKNDDW